MKFYRDNLSKCREYEALEFSPLLNRAPILENIMEEGSERLQESIVVSDCNEIVFYVHNKIESASTNGQMR